MSRGYSFTFLTEPSTKLNTEIKGAEIISSRIEITASKKLRVLQYRSSESSQNRVLLAAWDSVVRTFPTVFFSVNLTRQTFDWQRSGRQLLRASSADLAALEIQQIFQSGLSLSAADFPRVASRAVCCHMVLYRTVLWVQWQTWPPM